MKVLFAVSNENISTQIVKRYQKEYKEIISYKNMYYFNAIIKELQRDKSYDRIVISEDLEPFANNNYDAIDKFLFENGYTDEKVDKYYRLHIRNMITLTTTNTVLTIGNSFRFST